MAWENEVVPASELAAAMKRIKLQRLLGKKTMENELLKEAVESRRAKLDGRTRPYCRDGE